jgi:long-chain acyl-CoA synthetase
MMDRLPATPTFNPAFSAGGSADWIALYSSGVPASFTPRFENMLAAFLSVVQHAPTSNAIVYFDTPETYEELNRKSDALACWLLEKGIGKGARVSIVAQNMPAFPIACLAAWKIGAIPVPGNPMYRAGELASIFSDADPSALLCQTGDIDEMRQALRLSDRDIPVIVVSPDDGQSANDRRALPPTTTPEGFGTPLKEIVDAYSGECPPPIVIVPDDIGLILYTSGTTGAPKGAMLTHGAMAFNSEVLCRWCPLGPEDSILAIAPFFHITGLVCHICAAFVAGCSMVIHYRFEPHVVLEMVRRHKPTFTVGAITAFNALANVPGVEPADMKSLKKVYSGGAPIPPALRAAIQKKLGLTVHPCYGMTELTSPAVFCPANTDAPEHNDVLSIGVPVPSTEIRIVDEQGKDLQIGEPGELLVRGPQVMLGYWRKEADSRAALAGGWMHTGDIGFRDEKGWLYLIDRKKDVIIASGFKVWPREVEDVIYTHPAIREAAVIGVQDAYRGETVKAFVSLVHGASVTPEEIAGLCRERLAAYKVPRFVVILDDLPKTISGKIQRAALREYAAIR